VIQPRYEELLTMIKKELIKLEERSQQDGKKFQLAAGVVLTGGASQIEGLESLAEDMFQSQVRIASPLGVKGLTDYIDEPKFAAAVGMLRYGAENSELMSSRHDARHSVGTWFGQLTNWVKGQF